MRMLDMFLKKYKMEEFWLDIFCVLKYFFVYYFKFFNKKLNPLNIVSTFSLKFCNRLIKIPNIQKSINSFQ